MGNPEPNPYFEKTKVYKTRIKKDRCRDSMEAVLTNGVDYVSLVAGIRLSKLQKRWAYIPNMHVYILTYQTINHDPNPLHYYIYI